MSFVAQRNYMKKHSSFGILAIGILYLFACKTAQPSIEDEVAWTTEMDTIEVTPEPELEIYRASESRINDLIHTKLEVSFNWDSAFLYGKAWLSFTPYFYPTDSLVLDAKGHMIKEVALVDQIGKMKPLKFSYDTMELSIALDKTYHKEDTYKIYIDYVAMPDKFEAGGSSAITSEKGLYFINKDGSEEGKPKQIWTQGETESSSRWFPTIDAPNEKTTQEIYITVDTVYETLSNGKLLFQTENGDGSRTDYWKQELPHAPYLFMMAIGDFAIVEDQWKDIPVNYYVEHEYKEFAADIYPNTPEMIEFFSNKLNYPYPWDKYHQVVVRDYVSGAMENTGAVIYGDFVQGDDRFLIDNSGEDIVAHELFHHWFGDLVTTESWSNLPLNESFATYGEYLWNEHKYGRDQADYGLENDLRAYFGEARINKKKLIRFNYKNETDMFDTHSYQKGGRVLHMLRKELGDEAFFKSLEVYLKENEFQSVEIHNLRLAAEKVSGRDLNWFFNQWFFQAGHPELIAEWEYIDSTKQAAVHLTQIQEGDDIPEIYILPIDLEVVDAKGEVLIKKIKMMQRQQSFFFDMEEAPLLINVDADKTLLADIDQDFSKEEAKVLYEKGGNYLDRYIALKELRLKSDSNSLNTIEKGLSDPHWNIRKLAIQESKKLIKKRAESTKKTLLTMAEKDEKSRVRAEAFEALGKYYADEIDAEFIKKGLQDRSYLVVGSALEALAKVDNQEALKEAEELEKLENETINMTIAQMYAKDGDPKYNDFYIRQLAQMEGFVKYPLMISYQEFLENQEIDVLMVGLEEFYKIAEKENNWFMRMGGVNALGQIKKAEKDKAEALSKQISETSDPAATVELKKQLDEANMIADKVNGMLKKLAEKEVNDRLRARIEGEID